MNIAFTDIYGDYYSQDKLFDASVCKIGENLLVPIITLKEVLEKKGHNVHTVDVYNKLEDIDVLVFQNVPRSIHTSLSFTEFGLNVVRMAFKGDLLHAAIKKIPDRMVLLITEPVVVDSRSYDIRFHSLFTRVATWNPGLVKRYGYYQYYYPQPIPKKIKRIPFNEKHFCTMICGNKNSKGKNELYSERRRFIGFFENNNYDFDLYGIGWEKESLKNYKGKTDNKLITLSNYKFCICYENMCNVAGYVTEKIFDCFFSGVVPVYWGASNINKIIPKECYIDRRQFRDEKEVCEFMTYMDEKQYNLFLDAADRYLNSPEFNNYFSVDAYVNNMSRLIFGE